MIKLGMLIGGRYEVLEKIGTGGMSDVYKAKDLKLNRLVAVKVLKQEFSENRNFVSKFRVEAQAAAGLMHPNIVNVYDVGEENGIHYIVMELVEGITLKKYIEKKVRLTTKEAISIAIQVAMGIESAHNNHIIHRDIKPQNIIISKEGKVKVTDFGIAKAASSNTITSNVMGSVHYTSPEQARGGFSDEKSDIYSLGITMFEMLTGRVPFNSDTTVSVAIKHIQDPMPSMRDFVPEIPISVENIVMKCTQKSPDRRYQNIGDMIKDLKHSLINPDAVVAQVDTADDAGKTKIVPPARQERNSTESMENIDSMPEETPAPPPMPEVLNTVWEERVPRAETYASEEDLEEISNHVNTVKRKSKSTKPAYNTPKYGTGSYNDMTYYEDDDYYGETVMELPASKRSKTAGNTQKSGTKSKSANTKNTRTKSTKGTASKAASPKKQNSKKKKKKEYEYYDDYGSEAINRQTVRRNDYIYEEDDRYSKSYGKEYDYNPAAERVTTILTIVAAIIIGCILLYFAGQAMGVFERIGASAGNGNNKVSEDAKETVMPEFVGIDVEEVKTALHAASLGFASPRFAESTQYTKNQVISAALEDGTPVSANDRIPLNTTIILTVSAGLAGSNVPAVVGFSEAEGTARLRESGFEVIKVEEPSSEYTKGTIILQSPEGNMMAPLESRVTITISTGSEGLEVQMPSVLGNTKEAAVSVLEAAGITIGSIDDSYSSEYPEGQICYQSYEAGTSISADAVVDLKVSIGAEIATYDCNLLVDAPADYIGGNAEVILMTADGSQQLWCSQNVTAFPVAINLSGFNSSSAYGIVIISYLKNSEQLVTDADGNQTTQMTPEVAQIRQNVQFIKN